MCPVVVVPKCRFSHCPPSSHLCMCVPWLLYRFFNRLAAKQIASWVAAPPSLDGQIAAR
jgi:hypothetical protein